MWRTLAESDPEIAAVANAKTLAAVLSASGLRLVSGGTDNHLLVVDVFSKGLNRKMELIGELIGRALATPEDDRALAMIHAEVEALCRKFPLYPE